MGRNEDMSGRLAAVSVPGVHLKLHGWMPVICRKGQEKFRVGFGVIVPCALLFMCWIHVKGFVDYRECVSVVACLMGYAVFVVRLINNFFCHYFSLLLLWGFSIFCVKFEDTEEKRKAEKDPGPGGKDIKQRSNGNSLVNAEKFVKLYQSWLYEEETLGTEFESIEEKTCKFKIACKELKKVQIVIDSLKTRVLYNFQSPTNESRRVQDLIDKFEHTKTYMELRKFTLNMAQRQLSTFTEKGMALKIWLSEALEFQEQLHRTTCTSQRDIQQHFSLILGIRKDSEVIRGKLAEYEHSAQRLTATLQEISACSGIFHKALEGTNSQKRIGKWHDMLSVSVTEEATQVAQRFSTVTKLNECYQKHLDGLHQRALQEDSKSANDLSIRAL